MKRRIREFYTVMIARTDKEPFVFSLPPIAPWTFAAALATLIIASFLLGWWLGQLTTRKTALQLPITRFNQPGSVL